MCRKTIRSCGRLRRRAPLLESRRRRLFACSHLWRRIASLDAFSSRLATLVVAWVGCSALLAGFPEFWFTWRHLLKEFSKDYYCVAIDQRGYNISSKPRRVTQYADEYLVSDVEAVLRALQRTSCVLVAHDWGGAVAWSVAHGSDVVDKLIVLNIPHVRAMYVCCVVAHHPNSHRHNRGKALRTSAEQMRRSLYMLLFQVPFYPDARLRGRATAKLIGKDLKQTRFTAVDEAAFASAASQPGAMTAALNWYRNMLDGKRRKWLRRKLDAPVLLVYGEDDVAFSMDDVVPQSKAYCNDFTLKTIPNCSHWVQNDAPKKVIEAMRSFL